MMSGVKDFDLRPNLILVICTAVNEGILVEHSKKPFPLKLLIMEKKFIGQVIPVSSFAAVALLRNDNGGCFCRVVLQLDLGKNFINNEYR